MRIQPRVLLAALTAAILLALSAGTATAARSFSLLGGGRAILAVANEPRKLTFDDKSQQIVNDVTLHGSLHSVGGKFSRALLGVINRVTTGPEALCRTSVGLLCATIPLPGNWHVRLVSFTGTLPRIRTLRLQIEGVAFRLRINRTLECLYRGNAEGTTDPARERAEGQTFTSITALPEVLVTLFEARNQEFFRRCQPTGGFLGTLLLTSPITIRLI